MLKYAEVVTTTINTDIDQVLRIDSHLVTIESYGDGLDATHFQLCDLNNMYIMDDDQHVLEIRCASSSLDVNRRQPLKLPPPKAIIDTEWFNHKLPVRTV